MLVLMEEIGEDFSTAELHAVSDALREALDRVEGELKLRASIEGA
jgi:hypothetical protein